MSNVRTILIPVVLSKDVTCCHCHKVIHKGTTCYRVVRSQKTVGYVDMECMSGENAVSLGSPVGTLKKNKWEHMMIVYNVRRDSIGKMLDNGYDILEDGGFKSPVSNGFNKHSAQYRHMVERGEMSPRDKAPHMLRKPYGKMSAQEFAKWMQANKVAETINKALGYKLCRYDDKHDMMEFNLPYESREKYTERINACRKALDFYGECVLEGKKQRDFESQTRKAVAVLKTI